MSLGKPEGYTDKDLEDKANRAGKQCEHLREPGSEEHGFCNSCIQKNKAEQAKRDADQKQLEAQKKPQRRVVCAAIFKEGNLILGARHFDMLMHNTIELIGNGKFPGYAQYMRDAEQGFIDQWGVFMGREEALEVAAAAGQILKKTPPIYQLFSEDLY